MSLVQIQQVGKSNAESWLSQRELPEAWKGALVSEAVLRDYRSRDMAEKFFDAFKTEHGR